MIKVKKKHISKILSAVMSLTIVCGSVATVSYSAGAKSIVSTASESAKDVSKSNSVSSFTADNKKLSKNETVYVIADANGTPSKVIVSDWIKNTVGANKIKDMSKLHNIKNIKGDESYTIDEDNMYEWQADGNDIYYQGTSNEQLPVGLKITYILDGKKISPDELAGKSGKLTIHFDYDNRQFQNVKIDGKEEKIYVPFVMLTGMMLDNENYRNVEVSNGKIINDGTRTYVMGFALPGMQESLGIDKKDYKIPSSVEITADVKDFSLSTTLTLAVNDMFSDIDFSNVDSKIDKLTKSVNQLEDACNQLIDGSSQVYDGLSTLLDKSGELIEGIEQIYNGADKINSGAADLNKGAGTLAGGAKTLDNGVAELAGGASELDSGAGSLLGGANQLDNGVAELQGYIAALSSGLNEISANSSAIVQGAETVFNTLLSTADAQIAAAGITADKLTIDNYSSVLAALVESLSDSNVQTLAYNTALETVTATVESQRDVISSAVEAAVRAQVTEAILAAAGYSMTAEQYETAVSAGSIPDDVQLQVTQAVSAQMSSDEIKAAITDKTDEQIQTIIETNMKSTEVQEQIASAVNKAQAGRESLKALKQQLDSYNEFYVGIKTYTAGVDQANNGAQQILAGTGTLKNGTGSLVSGAGQLKNGTNSLVSGAGDLKNGSKTLAGGANELSDGTNTLKNGTQTLFDGISTLKDGSSALIDGVQQLKNGSMQLTDGLKKFKKEGIQALVDAVNGDAKTLVNRLKAISKVSTDYKSFSGISDDMNGKVDFIYKTDSIEK